MTTQPCSCPVTTVDYDVARLIVKALKAHDDNEALHRGLDRALGEIKKQRPFTLKGNHLRVQSRRMLDQHYDTSVNECDCQAYIMHHSFCWHRALIMILLVYQPMVALCTVVVSGACAPAPNLPRRHARCLGTARVSQQVTPAPYMFQSV